MKKRMMVGVAALIAPVAMANQVDVRNVGGGVTRSISVTLGGNTQNVVAGFGRINVSNGSGGNVAGVSGVFSAFSADPLSTPAAGTQRATSTSLTGLGLNQNFSNMSDASAQAVFNLFQAGGNREIAGNADWAAAFQIVLWEIIYDGPTSMDITTGNFQARQMSGNAFGNAIAPKIAELTQLMRNGPQAPRRGLISLDTPGSSSTNYIFERPADVVPLPPAAWAGLATMGLVVVGRRVRRSR